jgi:hypothetical protein
VSEGYLQSYIEGLEGGWEREMPVFLFPRLVVKHLQDPHRQEGHSTSGPKKIVQKVQAETDFSSSFHTQTKCGCPWLPKHRTMETCRHCYNITSSQTIRKERRQIFKLWDI